MVDDLSAEDQIERLKEEARSCTYPTDAATIKKRYKDTALILFKEDVENGTLRNYLTFGTRRSSSVSQYGNTPIVIRRSRSSNGELATVVEQVTTLQGRSTRSNYTLLEAAEKEKDTDSDEESYFHGSSFISDESFAVRGNHEEDSRLTADSNDSVLRDQETPAANKTDAQSPECPLERTSIINEQQNQDHDAEKSFNHHGPPVQQCRESADSETIQPHNDEVLKYDNKTICENSQEVPSEFLEAPGHVDTQQSTEPKRGSLPSQDSDHNFSPQTAQDGNHPQPTLEGKKTCQTFLQNTCEPTPAFSTNLVKDKICTPEIDHEAILREYVQQPSHCSKSLLQAEGTTYLNSSKAEKLEEESGENLKLVELKIVESTDSLFEQAYPGPGSLDPQKSLTTSDIPHLSDDSDVVFIDAGSPSLSRTKISCESLADSNEEVVQGPKEGANEEVVQGPKKGADEGVVQGPKEGADGGVVQGPKEGVDEGVVQGLKEGAGEGVVQGPKEGANEEVVRGFKKGAGVVISALDTPANPPPFPQTSEPETECKKSEINKEDVVTRRRHNSTNSFRDLPIRSPTPPRRRPQKSPRTPKLREKTKQRHSSLALTSDEEPQDLLTNGTRSASPTSKTGDFRFFSFSLKKEKSKSATSLGSKRNKEKVKLTSVKVSLEDPGAVNPKFVPNQTEEGHIENPGKRVGVRSMMIDGTIKQNFIVIHPSDDSDTIGLAPKSPQTTQKELSVSTPDALSTVKTHITAPNKEKLEVTKRISCQGGLKEELPDIPENIRNESRASFRGSLNFSQISRSLRIKQNKKNWEHVSLRSSQSLSSEPGCPSPSSSQILHKPPLSLSKVDCDSPTALAQSLDHTEDSKTVSKFCVVM